MFSLYSERRIVLGSMLYMLLCLLHPWDIPGLGGVSGTELAILCVLFLSLPIVLSGKVVIYKAELLFLWVFFAFQLAVLLSFFNSDADVEFGLSLLFKNTLFFIVFILTVNVFGRYDLCFLLKDNSAKVLILFFIVVSILGYLNGADHKLLILYVNDLKFSALQYGYYNKLFGGESIEDGIVTSAYRHGVMYLVFAFFVVYKVEKLKGKAFYKYDFSDFLILFLMFITLSRQVLVCYVLLLFMVVLKSSRRMQMIIASLSLVLLLFFIYDALSLNENLSDKLITDVQDNSRIEHYLLALEQGADNPLLGVGLGQYVVDAYAHNLFVHSYHQGGVVMLLFSLPIYVYVLSLFLKECLRYILKSSKPSWSALLALSLLSLPLMKMTLGVSGAMDFSSWVGLALFYSVKRYEMSNVS